MIISSLRTAGIGLLLAVGALAGFDFYKANLAQTQIRQMEERLSQLKSESKLTTVSQVVKTSIQKDYKPVSIPGTEFSIPGTGASATQSLVFKVSAGVDFSQVKSEVVKDEFGHLQVNLSLPPVQTTAVEQDYKESQIQVSKGLLSPSDPNNDQYKVTQEVVDRVSKEGCDRMADEAVQNAIRVVGSIFGESIQVKVTPATEQCVSKTSTN